MKVWVLVCVAEDGITTNIKVYKELRLAKENLKDSWNYILVEKEVIE